MVSAAVWLAAAPALGAPSDPSDDDFASIRLSDDEWNYEIVISDGTGGSVRTPVDRAVIGRPALSPDGGRVVYTSPLTDDSDGRYGLFITELASGATVAFTNPDKGDFDPAWSPDGQWIAFSRDTEGNLNPSTCCHIQVKRVDGSIHRSVPGTTGGTKPAWSPDGNKIAYERPDGIHVTNVDGTGDRTLTGAGGSEPAWSARNTIAYVRPGAGRWEIAVRPAAGGDSVLRVSSSQRIESPQWDPDGTTLYFLRYGGEGYDGRVGTAVWRDRAATASDLLFAPTRPLIHLAYRAHLPPSCDFDGDGAADLAVGVPGERQAGAKETGGVSVMYGTSSGLRAAGDQWWHQGRQDLRGDAGNGHAFGAAVACGDFDRDGWADLAAGIPGDTDDMGAVTVIRGASSGLTPSGDQRWHQDVDGVLGRRTEGNRFGTALAAADADGDGYADLAIGIPGDKSTRGAVSVIYGRPGGLAPRGDQRWHQGVDGIGGKAGRDHRFGGAVDFGDFDGDGYADLAVGVPGDKKGGGSVVVLHGSEQKLGSTGSQRWHEDRKDLSGDAAPGRALGSAVASGDFDRDGYHDLAVGIPGARNGGGAVLVLYGTATGIRAGGHQRWHQDSAGIGGSHQPGNLFGSALATGDFNRDGYEDLAIGSPGDKRTAGAVTVIYGTPQGLTAAGSQRWHQDSGGIGGRARAGNAFGAALSVGDLDGDGSEDLAIGSPGDKRTAGAVTVIYGTPQGLTAAGSQRWHQDVNGIADRSDRGDGYGAGL